MSEKYHQGRFKPKNPSKYLGDPTNVIYRSRWEFDVMRMFDEHPEILQWNSEEIAIPYRSPVDGRVHRYFPDFFVRRVNEERRMENVIIEVKPESQTKPPKAGGKGRRYIKEAVTYATNDAKWQAARAYCEDRGWKFQLLTKDETGAWKLRK